jgi:GDP-L-fucose synthase
VEKHSLIYVAGHRGLVGSAICRNLRQQGFERLLLRSRAELDLTDSVAVRRFVEQERPAHVFLAAAGSAAMPANL